MNNTVNYNNTEATVNSTYGSAGTSRKEALLGRIRIGLIIAAVSELAWIISFLLPNRGDTTAADIFALIGVVTAIAAYIAGGGLWTAIKAAWGFAKKLGWIGWFCVPFPFDILTGITLTLAAIILIPASFLCVPLLLVFLNYRKVKEETIEA